MKPAVAVLALASARPNVIWQSRDANQGEARVPAVARIGVDRLRDDDARGGLPAGMQSTGPCLPRGQQDTGDPNRAGPRLLRLRPRSTGRYGERPSARARRADRLYERYRL